MILEEVKNLYKIVTLKEVRRTKNVQFDVLDISQIPHIDSFDRVIHASGAISPGTVGNVEHFTVTADKICRGDEVCYTGAAMLVWPRGVFHRIVSCSELGSSSVNFAVHYEGFDIKTNFNIYDVDTETGKFKVIRAGHLDQK